MVELLTEDAAYEREMARQGGTVIAREATAAVTNLLRAEDRYWVNVFGGGDPDTGLTLDDLREWGEQIEEATIANPDLKHGLMLRASYIWKDGIKYRNIPTEARGRGRNVQALIDDPVNRNNFFGAPARKRRERCLYTHGLALYIGDNETKQLAPLPFHAVTAEYVNPGLGTEVWAYKVEYTEKSLTVGGEDREVKEWIFTDRFPGFPEGLRPKVKGKPVGADWKPDFIGTDADRTPVNKTKTIFDMDANGADGFTHGAPDALAALVWARIVRDLFMDGVTMTHALATFAFKATKGTQDGADKAQLALATPQTPGSTAVVGGVQELVPMSSAGKGYDFDSFRAVIARVASALDVSVIALSSDPGTAGSSYGSAQTLDLPTRLAMQSRRDEHVEFDLRVLRWMASSDETGRKIEAYFEPFEDATEMLRELQALILKWSTGLYAAEEMKKSIEGTDTVTVPDGVLLPNNRESWERSDIDPKDGPAPGTTKAPGQGQSTGAGRTGSSSDLRNDQIANNLKAISDQLEKMIAAEEARNSA